MITNPERSEILPDNAALVEYAAQWIAEAAAVATGPYAIALSGGSTPRALYQRLAEEPYRSRLPWQRLHLFWGDERFVPHMHPDSNYRMTSEALLRHVPIPPQNVHAIPTDGTPEDAAERYQRALQQFYGASRLDAARPLFDLVLLGVGEDGHTASLFPGTAVLEESEAWVAAVIGAKPEPRITLTYPAIASSRAVAFLASGAGKREILKRVRAGDSALPAARVRSTGAVHWWLDRAAGE